YTGVNCETKTTNNCAAAPCSNGGSCIDALVGFTCICRDGFTGATCATKFDYCTKVTCSNAGTCVSYGIRSICNCPKGYNGDKCATKIDYCLEKPCGPKGTCASTTNGATCTCIESYTGTFCFTVPKYCGLNTCTTATEMCIDSYKGSKAYCVCPSDYNSAPAVYTSARNGYSITSLNLGKCGVKLYCAQNPCLNGGTCKEGTYTFVCTCATGYKGATCNVNIDNCIPNPCKNKKKCTDLVNDFSCACGTDYSGKDCSKYIAGCASNKCSAIGTDVTLPNKGCNEIESQLLFQCICKVGYYSNLCSVIHNNCNHNPCVNGACTSSLNAYSCSCTAGWSGKNCDEPLNICLTKTCQNSGVCNTIFNDIYCACTTGYSGNVCETKLTYCDANSCLGAGSTCVEAVNKYTCTCVGDYSGSYCEYNKKACAKIVCENNGKLVHDGNKYVCQCQLDFEGTLCEKSKDNCLNVNIVVPAKCIDGIGTYYILCPPGYESSDCKSKANPDFDLKFFSNGQNQGVRSLHPFLMDSSALTFGLWFKLDTISGTLFQLFELTSSFSIVDARKIIDFDVKKITVSIDPASSVSYTFNANLFSIEKWYYVVIAWDNVAGNLEIYVNSAKEYTMNNYALNKKLAKYGTVSLGAAYTPNNHDFTANTKITGSITRVTGWSKQLTHTEISTLSGSPTSTVVPNLMVHWGQYMIGSGVSVIRPSKVTEVVSVCPVGFTGANCKTPLKDKISPIFKSCPSNKIHTTSTGKVQSSWDIPIVEGATTTPQSNYALGASLNPDTYNIVYIAYDASKNAAICSFYYTVQELLCLTPKLNVADKFATQFCSTGYYPVKHCAPKCPKNSAFLVASPNIYTCGTQGSFSYRNTLTVTYPKCEIVKQENLNAKVLIRYDSITACLQLLNTNTIKDHFCKIMNTVNQKWGKTLGGKNALCPNGDCCTSSNVKLVISCHTPSNLDLLLANSVNAIKRRRRQTQSQNSALITLSIDGIPLIVYDSTLSQEAQNLIYHFLLDLGASDLTKLLVNGNPTFITLNTIPSCLEGQTLQNNNCYDCPIGTYFVAGECFNCPINTYQPLTKQTLCLSCPVNQITMNTGSIALTDCIDKCPIGKYHGFNLVNGIQVPVCIDCPKGSYQDLIGQTVCKYCDADKTTQNLGSTTITSCYIICPSGQEYIMTSCKDCPIDRYRTTGVNFNCVSCPANFIATAPGAKIAAECTISACAAGNYRNVATNVCIACPRGQYQPAIWQTSCISCPAGKTTVGTASTALTNCLFYCAPGSYQADLAVETCSPCLVGFFKDNDIPKKECTACISPFVTASTASKLITDCNVLKCPKGNEGKVDKCIPCQIGFYKDNENVNQMCVACPKTHVTISTGSIASTDCNIPICKIGYENIDGICQPCKVGFYKSTVGPLDVCIVCPINYATAVTGATSNTDCNLLKCPKGKQEIFGVCTDCPVAYFKSVDTPKSFCVNCPVSYTTIGVGSKSLLDCKLLICQKGYHEVAQICVPCIIGYYKDNELPTKLCVKCPSSHVTKTTGSTSSNDCNVHICPKGYEEENYQCNPCKIGYYKDITTANVKCSICPITHSTKNIGSDSLSDCNVLRCELGQEDINGVCVACIQGYYKDNTNAGDECKHCPDSYTTVKTGSIYKSDCILHICPKGFENLNDKCTPCKLGYYKDNEDPLEVCKICPATFSTYSIGATKVEDCNLKLCPKGFEEVAQMCTPCKVGFYKNNDLTNTKCVACPITFITENTGSQKVEDCSVHKCDAGYESINDQCSPCSVGYYKNNNYPSQKCYKCPATFVTATMASKYITDCKLQKCEPGYESINNLCSPCPLNKYKDNNNYAEMCSDCPSTYLTHFTASTSINDCNLLQCDEGFEENDGRCSPCKIGYYKDNNLPLKVCAKCPSTFITEKMSSESINDCNLLICQKGYEEIKGTCVACEIGSYKENEIPESRCIKCPPTFMTKFTGSILASDCNIQKCPAGQYSKYSKCIYCQIGYFRTVDGSLYECTKCPNEYSTVKMGSQSIFDCSEHICPLGQESIQGICQSCKIGYYKGTNSKEDCKPCPIGIFTKRIGSTSDSDCNVKNCPEGYENINLQCYPCKVGFYKDSDDHSLCKKCYNERLTINSASTSISNCTVESCGAGKYYNMDRKLCTICDIGEYRESDGDALKCEKCNNDLITEYEGSVSYNDCNIVKCEPGTRRINDDLCEKCQIGYYQTKKWQTKCEKCPVNYTTLKIGQDSESDCIYDCDTGYEKSDNEDKCVECERGYYRNKFQNVKCIKCPIAFTTPDIGSGSPLDCNI
ncbi:Epidermal growth factor-related protein 3, partial [Intoshia linei]